MKKILFSLTFLLGIGGLYSNSAVVKSSLSFPDIVIKSNAQSQLIDIFKSCDPRILQSNDEEAISKYLKEKNKEIILYLSRNYPQFGPIDSVDTNDPSTVLLGLFYAVAEANNFQPFDKEPSLQKPLPAWLRCTVDVCLGYFDIREIIGGLGTFEFGTVWKVIKTSIKKYVGFLGAAILIYDIITECL